MDLSFSCKNIIISPDGRYITVDISEVAVSDLLNEIDIDEAIKHYTIK